MTKKDKQRQIAEDWYIRLGMTAKEIANQLEVSENTLTKWKKGKEGESSWDVRRKLLNTTPAELKELIVQEALRVAKGEESIIDADEMSKFVSAIDRLDKKTRITPSIVADVFKGFDNWVSDVDQKTAVSFLEYHKLYLQHRIKMEVENGG